MENFAPVVQAMKGKNPQDILMTMARNMPVNNPLISQLINMAKTGNNQDMFNLASSYFNQNGINIDIKKEFQTFLSMLK